MFSVEINATSRFVKVLRCGSGLLVLMCSKTSGFVYCVCLDFLGVLF